MSDHGFVTKLFGGDELEPNGKKTDGFKLTNWKFDFSLETSDMMGCFGLEINLDEEAEVREKERRSMGCLRLGGGIFAPVGTGIGQSVNAHQFCGSRD